MLRIRGSALGKMPQKTAVGRFSRLKPHGMEVLMAKHLKVITNWDELLQSTNYSPAKFKEKLNATVRQLSHQTHDAFGLPFLEWIESRRLKQAKKLLRRGDRVKEVANKVGFGHAQNF